MKTAASLLLMLSSARSFLIPQVSKPKSTTARNMVNILDLLSGGGSSSLIAPEKALPGRPEPMTGIEGLSHYVLKNPLTEVPPGYKEAVFGNGCFWGTEKSFWRLPQGTVMNE